MNTLNEVIKAFEECIVPKNVFCNGCYKDDRCKITEDALNYLKQYQSSKDELNSTRLAYLDILTDYVALKLYWAEQQENPPLTWEELKQMEGKPVWVETQWARELDSEWMVINYLLKFEDGTEALLTSCGLLDQKRQSNTWKAYRKERE